MGAVYAAVNKEGSAPAYYERPATIDLIGDPAGLRVLKAGCGPGGLTEWLTTHGAMATAFDISPEMVRLAAAAPLVNATFSSPTLPGRSPSPQTQATT